MDHSGNKMCAEKTTAVSLPTSTCLCLSPSPTAAEPNCMPSQPATTSGLRVAMSPSSSLRLPGPCWAGKHLFLSCMHRVCANCLANTLPAYRWWLPAGRREHLSLQALSTARSNRNRNDEAKCSAECLAPETWESFNTWS